PVRQRVRIRAKAVSCGAPLQETLLSVALHHVLNSNRRNTPQNNSEGEPTSTRYRSGRAVSTRSLKPPTMSCLARAASTHDTLSRDHGWRPQALKKSAKRVKGHSGMSETIHARPPKPTLGEVLPSLGRQSLRQSTRQKHANSRLSLRRLFGLPRKCSPLRLSAVDIC